MEGLLKYIPINWALMKHPTNWITIVLMLVFALIVFDLGAKGLTNFNSKSE